MNIGCIILTNTKDLSKYGMCQRAIHSLLWSEQTMEFNIVVVESNKNALNQGFIYDLRTPNILTVTPDEEFGYNKFLNIGINMLRVNRSDLPEWVIIANSDIIFTQHWLTNMLEWQKNNNSILSMSPWEPNWHTAKGLDKKDGPFIGYRVSYEITGWCLVIHRDVFSKCGLFDPQFKFWYQDNDYALTLKKENIKHALIPSSRVYHMVSGTHDIIPPEKLHQMTHGQHEIFKRKWNYE